MKLFDEMNRVDFGHAEFGKPIFDYLNRSAAPEFETVRCELEKWFKNYPPQGQRELRAGFRSRDDTQHFGAFFQLFIHELLLRLGCRVTLHPSMPGGRRRPDFLAESSDGERFYIEATITPSKSDEERSKGERENYLIGFLNKKVNSPDFLLLIQICMSGQDPPPARSIASFVQKKLDALYQPRMWNRIPEWTFEDKGWKVKFTPIPRAPEARGKSDLRPLHLIFPNGETATLAKGGVPLRKVITKKAGAYGDLDLPYVIAVSFVGAESPDEIDITNALFGEERWHIAPPQEIGSPPQVIGVTRSPNGVWVGPKGPQWTRVSAVLLAHGLFPRSIPGADLRLWHNPWAKRPYKSVLTRLPQVSLVEGKIQQTAGISTAEVFGLPPSWPRSE